MTAYSFGGTEMIHLTGTPIAADEAREMLTSDAEALVINRANQRLSQAIDDALQLLDRAIDSHKD